MVYTISLMYSGVLPHSVTPHSQSSKPVEAVMSWDTLPANLIPEVACSAISRDRSLNGIMNQFAWGSRILFMG